MIAFRAFRLNRNICVEGLILRVTCYQNDVKDPFMSQIRHFGQICDMNP